jgi:excisionase family DNA binding protein
MNKEILTVEEAAALLSFQPDTVREYAREGKLPAVKIGRAWRFVWADLMGWLRAQSRKNGARVSRKKSSPKEAEPVVTYLDGTPVSPEEDERRSKEVLALLDELEEEIENDVPDPHREDTSELIRRLRLERTNR